MKVGKVETTFIGGELIFTVVEEPVEKTFEELMRDPKFKRGQKKLQKDIDLIQRSAIVDPTKLKMRFVG